ncbi:chloramphenical resistance permease RarD [Piscirickettsia salmonis]|nr:EamA family transporter RarD [Piscirickettsia salmonis]ALA25769.1 protein rarD [Piscirickettsia salmonis]APS43253.1 chloramphenical resistance permease RarD [Piscirickettsia salmonis]APS46601.1 chloramphenical resistance permease RarD [Piscirickettsia salmonis]APS50578.1 chloramphenical resistance permease RarD [Piscirickettsia salmonis]APS53781.1 chloramphenical resistance permease RarD [Piscirickettsia salmonis]
MSTDVKTKQGIIYAILGYGLWGLSPIYYKQIMQIPALEILANRIIWSCVLLAIISLLLKQLTEVRKVLTQKNKVIFLFFSTLFLACNWLIYIWAVNNDHVLETSLGYYVNPILNIILAMVILKERLRVWQWFAVALVVMGVLIQIIHYGSLPWVSLGLAFTFGCYGMLRKKLGLAAVTGLLCETALLTPFALIYLHFFDYSATANFIENTTSMNVLLMLAGVVTVIPLLGFTAAATRLKFSILSFFQYLTPTILFIIAVTLYGEKLTLSLIITFFFIWLALVVLAIEGLARSRARGGLSQSKSAV